MIGNHDRRVIIVGGGIAGLAVARLLSENGLPFTLVERSDKLGGHTKDWACMAVDECKNCFCCLVFDYEDTVASCRNSEILVGYELSSVVSSDSGIQRVKVRQVDSGAEQEIQASALVLAIGFDTFDPVDKGFWGYGQIDGVLTLADLNHIIRSNDLGKLSPVPEGALDVAFFQCIGSRDKSIGANYCSQYCCGSAIRAALKLIHEVPGCNVSIFYIDLQLPGKTTRDLMEEAQEKGVRFLQGVPGEIRPLQEGGLQVISEIDGQNVAERFDRIVLSVGQRPSASAAAISKILGAPLNEFGFFETRTLFDAVRSPANGVYIAGSCSSPASIPDVAVSAGTVVSAIIADIEKAS
ncbi:MAG: FAD-dependent oxidoreductase [Deltaproteobacteria bacterium]|nr:FAD-dependent oxidoreductase [Deltaproteobacteria bacterium]